MAPQGFFFGLVNMFELCQENQRREELGSYANSSAAYMCSWCGLGWWNLDNEETSRCDTREMVHHPLTQYNECVTYN